jgi:hypothetical protein
MLDEGKDLIDNIDSVLFRLQQIRAEHERQKNLPEDLNQIDANEDDDDDDICPETNDPVTAASATISYVEKARQLLEEITQKDELLKNNHIAEDAARVDRIRLMLDAMIQANQNDENDDSDDDDQDDRLLQEMLKQESTVYI